MRKIIVGGMLVCAVVLICMGSINSFSTMVSVLEEEEFKVDGIEMLNFQTTAADIEIKSSSSDHIAVKLEGKIKKKLKDKFRVKIDEDGVQLKVSYLSNDNSLGIQLGSERDMTLRVTLPERTYKALSVHTTSGNIEAVSVSAGNINLKSASGNQDIKKFTSEDTLSIQSTSGDIELERNMMNNFSIGSTSGSVKIEELVSRSGKITTKSGDVKVLIEEMINSLDVITTSGDVRTTFKDNPESLKIDFQGDSGEPDIKLKNIMYEDKSENSAIGLIGDGIKILNVKTTSGDFTAE
ncbi:DUF4097 family beta strand repeat-containing protein [Lysinibacillus sp. NPDC096418]|uniref:DUF4097 family beta strand repeat-containing protein n=1 Tax=Lysinibacillus sp. NPDC096418 TaxID=3364138 RepID=UPI003827A514